MPIRFRQAHLSDSSDSDAVFAWMMWVVDMTDPFASMFKLNRAYYESIDGGEQMLRMLITFIHQKYPDIPVFVDCKRGDIDRTQEQYGKAHLRLDDADGMTYSPYMGKSTLASLVSSAHYGRKALVGLGRTSNPDAWEMQDVIVRGDRRYWEHIVDCIMTWSIELNVVKDAGVVMGAAYMTDATHAYSEHLKRCREIVGNRLWFMIPGIGAQKGLVEETVKAAFLGAGSVAINSSSGITNAEDPAGAAEKTRDEIRAASGILH